MTPDQERSNLTCHGTEVAAVQRRGHVVGNHDSCQAHRPPVVCEARPTLLVLKYGGSIALQADT